MPFGSPTWIRTTNLLIRWFGAVAQSAQFAHKQINATPYQPAEDYK